MKLDRASFKNRWQRVKSTLKTQRPSASAAQETSIVANPIAHRKSKKKSAVSPVGTLTSGDVSHRLSTVSNSTSHEQLTRTQSANLAATAEAPVQPRRNIEIINRKVDADAAPEQLPVGFNLNSGAAKLSGSSNGLLAASEQTATNHMTTQVNGAPVIVPALAPVAGPVTASNAPPSELVAPAKSPPVKPGLVRQSSRAVIWQRALKTLQENDPKKYKVLDKVLENLSIPENDKVRELSESKREIKALLLRVKKVLPSVGTFRAVTMTIAAADIHGIAPSVVAGSFFVIDVLLGRFTPEDERKIRNMLFESVMAIEEWISFETPFLKRHHVVEQDVQNLEDQLPYLYNLALQLLCNLLTASNASWLKKAGDKLSAQMVKWQEQVEELKDHRAKWTARRKLMEEALSRLEHIAKVLDLIKSADDLEQSLEALSDRATSEGRHKDSASWILDNQAFKAWSPNFYSLEPSVSTTSDVMSKRVLWISGSYGVGKTTIVHRVVSELQRLADGYLQSGVIQEEAPKAKGLQVIPYFCDTSKRTNYETIIRSIGRKLSLLPNFTIAKVAQEFSEKTSDSPIYIKEYENLVRSLFIERSKSYNIALIIDALNECDPPQDAQRLCGFISEIVSKNPQVRVLFSSHEQLSGSEKLKGHLEKVEVVAIAPGNELRDFVQTEIKFRQAELKDSGSIFLNPEYKFLLDKLQQSLIDGAKGMYGWVKVWLDITLPLQNDLETVMLEDHAEELLNALQKSSTGASEANEQLQAGYQRLWAFGALKRFDEIRKRLFRFVICAFAPLKLSTVTHALRIGIEDSERSYRTDFPDKKIDKLCSNFLLTDGSGYLTWTHDSARDFIVRVILNPGIDLAETSAQETFMKSNHLLVAKTFIAVMRDSNHPVWKELDFDPFERMLRESDRRVIEGLFFETGRVIKEKIRDAQSSLEYLGMDGWRHCQHAADNDEVFDPLWTRIVRELILQHKTAFALWWQLWFEGARVPFFGRRTLSEIFGDYAGERVILISHTLALLSLKADSISDVQLEKAAKAPLERSTEEDLVESLVQHAACKNLNGANVLHLACSTNNGSILNLMLQAILHRHGGLNHVFKLLTEVDHKRTPLSWASFESRFSDGESKSTMETLLRFETNYSRQNGCDQSSNWAPSDCLWGKRFMRSGTALNWVLWMYEDDDEIIRLLDIHKPCNIDQTDNKGETALHIAALYGRFKLVKALVERYHATVDVPDNGSKTPLDVARDRLEFLHGDKSPWAQELPSVIKYLESIKPDDSHRSSQTLTPVHQARRATRKRPNGGKKARQTRSIRGVGP